MDFLVKVGDTGLAFPYTNIPPNEKISYLQTKIRSDTRIEIKDQVLITKKGHRLQQNDVFANLEKENQFQATTNRTENPLRSLFTIYVFDQKKFSEKPSNKEKYSSYFMDVSDSFRNYLLEANIIDRDFTMDFQSQVSDNTVLENIRANSSKILEVDSKLFGHYSAIKKKFLQYKSKRKRLERLMEENENQLLSFDVLLKHASLSYNPCKSKKEDVLKRLLQNEEKNSGILQKFEEGLENLKKIELHDALKTEKQKFLIDIYYNIDAMKRWRNNCIDLQNTVKNKIDKSSQLIKSIKEKLRDEKDKNAKLVRTQLQSQNVNMESFSHEEETILTLVKKCYESYKSVREALENYSNQSDDENKKVLSDPKWEEMDMKEWEEALSVCIKNIEKIDKALDCVTKMKMNFEIPIIVFYNTIMRLVAELNMISNEKMKQLNDEIDKMERDFSYLLNPGNLPVAYKAALTEVSRRREFIATFERKSKKLKEILDTETEKRKKFLAQFGRVLPSEFIPQLKNMPPTFKVENIDTDSGLPAIDNLHQSESASNAPASGSITGREHKQIEELTKQINEYKAEILKLRGEETTSDIKRRLENIVKEFESERERNKLLKAKLNDVEKEQLNSSLKKGISKEESTKQRDSKELQEDLELLTRTVSKCLASIKSQDVTVNGFEGGNKEKENLLNADKHQLVQRIEALNVMVEQVSKASLGVFSRKLNEKQQRFDDMRTRYEGLLMKVEESLQKETTKLEAYYEEKIKDLNHKYSDAQKRIAILLEEAGKHQKEISLLKTEMKEKTNQYQTEIDNIKKDVKIKLDLMKSKDEIIKSLSDMKTHLTKEVAETTEKMKKQEQKLKAEHTEAIANVHSLHKSEVDTFKARIKGLERDISNKNIELDKIEYNLTQSQKEVKQKEEQISKLENTVTTLNDKLTKMNEEIVNYKNKIDNMDLNLQKKTSELNASTKLVNQLTSDKNSLSNDLTTYKEFNGELTKKVQSLNELWKKAESERKNLKSENDRLALEVEKKQVEIQNLNTQITKVSKERKEQIDELNKIAEDHQTERMKISSLQEEVNQKNIEINTLKTKLDILSLDMDNKVRENEHLLSKFETSEKEKEKLEGDLQKITKDLEEEKGKMRETQKQLEDMKVICEQLQIEVDMKTEKCEGLKKNNKEMLERAEKAETSLAQCLKQNESLTQQSFEKSSASNTKIQEIKERVMQLEEEIRQRNNELKEKEEEVKTFRSEKTRIEEELQEITVKYESEKRTMREKEESSQAAQEEAENEKRIIEEFKKQEDSYKQEVENKQEEIEELKKKNEEVIQEVEKLRNENFLFNSEVSSQKGEIERLLSQCQTQSLSKMDYLKIEKGAKLLFIPYAAGIYVPFILHQYMNHEIESVIKTGKAELDPEVYKKTERSIKPAFFLDLESLNESYQKILEETSMLIVGTVGEIKSKLNKDINPKEQSMMIGLDKIEYIVGFDDDDMVMKNYAITLS